METILLGAVLCALLVLIVLLVQLQRSLTAGEEIRNQQAREEADRLRDSLDQKVTLSMSVVSDRLAMVNRGLGSMQSLAQGVGDLKKVLTNVKNRGIWGEMQLGNLLGDMLAPEQYGTNVAIRPRSQERVEFAIRLPGRTGENPVWLPIDAKFPLEDYQRLVQAREEGDADAETLALKQLEIRLKSEAKDIRDKYIAPPYSTDFGLLYLPLEGLFAEAVSRPHQRAPAEIPGDPGGPYHPGRCSEQPPDGLSDPGGPETDQPDMASGGPDQYGPGCFRNGGGTGGKETGGSPVRHGVRGRPYEDSKKTPGPGRKIYESS